MTTQNSATSKQNGHLKIEQINKEELYHPGMVNSKNLGEGNVCVCVVV